MDTIRFVSCRKGSLSWANMTVFLRGMLLQHREPIQVPGVHSLTGNFVSRSDVGAHVYNSSTQKVEAGGSHDSQGYILSSKLEMLSQKCRPLILATAEAEVELCELETSLIQSEFQDSQDCYTEKPCLENLEQKQRTVVLEMESGLCRYCPAFSPALTGNFNQAQSLLLWSEMDAPKTTRGPGM